MPSNRDLSILIIARHFPPSVSGGARRPFMWVKGLNDAGVRTFVIAPELPEGVDGSVVQHPNPDPSTRRPGRTTLRDRLRTLLLWPDPDIRWTRRAIRRAREACPFQPDWIFTTSPPESVHVAGRALKRVWPHAKWALDARDHWMVRPFRSERRDFLRKLFEPRLARHILDDCDLLLTVNQRMQDEFHTYCPNAVSLVVPHFAENSEPPHRFDSSSINLVHTGSFALSDPDTKISDLLIAFELAVTMNSHLKLHLLGRLRDDEIARVDASTARDAITLHGVVPLAQSLSFQAGADALLVVAAPQAPVPPGKLAEYVAAGRPIIPVGTGPWRVGFDSAGSGSQTDAERLAAVSRAEAPPQTIQNGTIEASVTPVLEAMIKLQ